MNIKESISKKCNKFYYVDTMPEGFRELKGATTAPCGYKWFYNGLSLFNKKRIIILVKEG